MPSKLTFAALLALGAMTLSSGAADASGSGADHFYSRAEQTYHAAQAEFLSGTNAAEAWRFGRATFEYAALATNDTQRAAVAREGIAACRKAIEREPDSGPAYYYLATNLGELAQAEAPSLAAYRLVHEVERAFLKAAELDVHFANAGPARSLGELYFKAPGWPLSIGSNRKAREWLETAAKIEPNYPGNQLNLAEARLKWHERKNLEISLQAIESIWPSARTNFTGSAWDSAWIDWSRRRNALKEDYQKLYGSKP